MKNNQLSRAMLFAAGRGERLRPLTDTCPKPLLPIQGKSILDHTLDELQAEGIQDVMINVSYLGHMIMDHFQHRTRPTLHFSHEFERLETGGGILNILDFFQDQPFFAINGDTLWHNKTSSPFALLKKTWDPLKMDILLMMVPLQNAHGYVGQGNYHWGKGGHLHHRKENEIAPYIYGGVQILNPMIFKNHYKGDKFSLKILYNSAERNNRLYGALYDGDWFEIGTPERYEATQEWFQQQALKKGKG